MDQHTGLHQFQTEASVSCAPFECLLDMTVVEAAEGRAMLT